MPPVSLPSLLAAARDGGYAVPAFNVVDEQSMAAVIEAAVSERSPVIVQTSARVARTVGPRLVVAIFQELADQLGATAVLQLDHCDDATLARQCIDARWQAVLFDGSALDPKANGVATRAIVEYAHPRGAAVEGELEAIRGTEDGVGVGGRDRHDLNAVLGFIAETQIDCFAPSIGNVHGHSDLPVALDVDRVTLLERSGVSLALHGGTGLGLEVTRELIAAGINKINVSTALREAYVGAARKYLADHDRAADPVPMLDLIRSSVRAMAVDHIRRFGSADTAVPPALEVAR